MSNDETEKAAREYAQKRCETIQKRRDLGLAPYPIRPEIEKDFLAGYEHSRKDFIRDDLPKLLELARETNECECEECDGTWCKPRKREKLHSNVEGLCKFVLKKAKETK